MLPQTATIVVEHSTGATSINQVEFSHCRPYSTTSSILFGGDDAVVGGPAVVLHLFQRHDVGLGQIGHDAPGERRHEHHGRAQSRRERADGPRH